MELTSSNQALVLTRKLVDNNELTTLYFVVDYLERLAFIAEPLGAEAQKTPVVYDPLIRGHLSQTADLLRQILHIKTT